MVGNILGGCLFESVLTIWCSSLLEDARAILSEQIIHLAVGTSLEELCFACLYKSLKIVNFMFLHFLSAWRLSHLAMKSSSLIDSNHGEKLWVMTFRWEWVACIYSSVHKKSQNWFAFSTDENSETLVNFSIKWWTVNISHVPDSSVWGRRHRDWIIEVGFSAIMVWFRWVSNSRFYMDVIVRSNNNTVNDMKAPVSGPISELNKVI